MTDNRDVLNEAVTIAREQDREERERRKRFLARADVEDLLHDLARLRRREAEVQEEIEDVVALARQAGASWEQVGGALGITRQGAWIRFKREG